MSNSTILEKNIKISFLTKAESEVSGEVELSDNYLIERILADDGNAFELLFERYKRLVGSIASNYFRQPDQIEEAIQKTFVKAYFELKNFRGNHQFSFASWVSRITVNICLDTLRSNKRRGENESLDLSENEQFLLNSIVDSTEVELINQDLVEKLLSRLEVDDRAVLQLLDGEERSVSEIADLLGWSKAKVKVRAFRARNSLREILKKLL